MPFWNRCFEDSPCMGCRDDDRQPRRNPRQAPQLANRDQARDRSGWNMVAVGRQEARLDRTKSNGLGGSQ